MKIAIILSSLLTIVFLGLAFYFESITESRLFLGLSIFSGANFFRLASQPAPVPALSKEKKQHRSPEYAHQEY